MRLLDRLERKFRPYAVPNVTIVIIMGQVLAFILSRSNAEIVEKMELVPRLVMDGEIWRLGSFCFVPPDIQPLFLFFAMMIFYRMGSALEQIWGAARYNLFLICGYLTTVAAAFFAASAATNMFIGTSVFLAFAWLYPNHVFYIMFILPVKVRWLALLAWIGLIYVCSSATCRRSCLFWPGSPISCSSSVRKSSCASDQKAVRCSGPQKLLPKLASQNMNVSSAARPTSQTRRSNSDTAASAKALCAIAKTISATMIMLATLRPEWFASSRHVSRHCSLCRCGEIIREFITRNGHLHALCREPFSTRPYRRRCRIRLRRSSQTTEWRNA